MIDPMDFPPLTTNAFIAFNCLVCIHRKSPVETKGGVALLQWAIQMALEAKPNLAATSPDATNVFGEIECECPGAALRANLYMHSILQLFEMIYKREAGELWYCDENGRFVMGARNRRGVKQGSVMGMFMF